MKSILMSIKPKWVEKIASGEKTVEVRKTAPKLAVPFKCYISCTKPSKSSRYAVGGLCFNTDELYRLPCGDIKYGDSVELMGCDPDSYSRDNFLNGKVVGEFVCDEIIVDEKGENQDIICENACLTRQELLAYEPRKTLYGLHISDLKIYDKPRDITEFKRANRTEENAPCAHTKWLYGDCASCKECNLTRPPQSWQYVEEL